MRSWHADFSPRRLDRLLQVSKARAEGLRSSVLMVEWCSGPAEVEDEDAVLARMLHEALNGDLPDPAPVPAPAPTLLEPEAVSGGEAEETDEGATWRASCVACQFLSRWTCLYRDGEAVG
jgi:hypothetical protein